MYYELSFLILAQFVLNSTKTGDPRVNQNVGCVDVVPIETQFPVSISSVLLHCHIYIIYFDLFR